LKDSKAREGLHQGKERLNEAHVTCEAPEAEDLVGW
jgi:hypothetical protein